MMKYSIWMIAVIVWTVSNGFSVAMDIPRDQMRTHQDFIQIAFMYNGPGYDMPISTEGKAEAMRKEFMDKLSELRGKDSDLEMQTFKLNQENFDMQSQLEQNELELKQVKFDWKDVQRVIKEIEREKHLFDKKDKLRKSVDK
jgi:hypothetical protein